MKKIISLILVLMMLIASLVACQAPEEYPDVSGESSNDNALVDNTQIRVAVMSGTTGFGIAPLISSIKNGESKLDAKIDIYSDATLVPPLVISKSVDIAAVPTNLASTLYNKTNGGISVIGVNTLGVLYVLENGESVKSLADLEGKTVYMPGQGTNPEYLFRALLALAGLTDKVTLDYTYTTPDELSTAVIAGNAKLALLPEPKVTAVMNNNSAVKVSLDLTAEWKKLAVVPLVQGCLIVRNEFAAEHPELLGKFIEEYAASVNKVNAEPESASQMIADAGIVGNAALALKAIPRCNITWLVGDEMKSALNSFWNELFKLAPSAIGGKLPDDAIFYSAE